MKIMKNLNIIFDLILILLMLSMMIVILNIEKFIWAILIVGALVYLSVIILLKINKKNISFIWDKEYKISKKMIIVLIILLIVLISSNVKMIVLILYVISFLILLLKYFLNEKINNK